VKPEITLGERIARWREWRGLSQVELAARVREHDGRCSPSALAQWELDQTAPTQRNEQALCDALEITRAQFWGRIPAKKRQEAKAS
jgi:transcriptional regulator with XRE-family HTH domain